MPNSNPSVPQSLTIIDIVGEDPKLLIQLFTSLRDTEFAKACAEKIIAPRLAHINAKSGQENDPLFLAYVIQHWLNK